MYVIRKIKMKNLITIIVMPVSIAVHAQKDSMHIVGMDTTVEFKSVQTEAQFPGGVKGWQRYLEANSQCGSGCDIFKTQKRTNNHAANDGIFPCRHLW